MEAGGTGGFEQIQSEFSSVLATLSTSGELFKFKQEYEKIFKGLFRSRIRVEGNQQTIQMLTEECQDNKFSYEKSSKNLEKDNSSLSGVEKQIVYSNGILEEMKKNEENMKERMKLLRKQIADMMTLMKEGIQLSPEQQERLQQLMDYKSKLANELDEEQRRIVMLRNAVADASDKLKASDMERQRLEAEISDLKQKDATKRSDIERESRNKDSLEKDLKAIRSVVASKQLESKSRLEIISRLQEDISLLELSIKNQNQLIEQFAKDKEANAIKTSKITIESKELTELALRLAEINEGLDKEVKEKTNNQLGQKNELRRVLKQKEEASKKVVALENVKVEVEAQRRELRAENEEVSVKIDISRKNLETLKKNLDDLSREKSLLGAMMQRSEGNVARAGDLFGVYAQVNGNLEFDVQRQKRTNKKMVEEIRELSEQRNGLVNDCATLQRDHLESVKALKQKEAQIYEFRKQMTEVEKKLKHQQALYEAVQNDRNIHSKHLLESQNEISHMKRRLKTMYFQINNFKEEIKNKNTFLARESTENLKLTDEIKAMNQEIGKLKHQNDLSVAYVRKQTAEQSSLIQFLKGAEFERSRQEHSLRLLYAERDNLSAQLIKQNMELSRVYDELRIVESNLQHVQLGYLKTLQSLHQQQKSVAETREQRTRLKAETNSLRDVKFLVTQFEYELMNEELKFNTLARTALVPMNIHRWRTLENSNPKLFELIQTAQQLQKKVIKHAEEEKMKESMIQYQEKIYLQLRAVYSKQVGSEALEQIKEFQNILSDKNETLKSLTYQVKMVRAQARESEYKLDQVDKTLAHARKKYVAQRMKAFTVDPTELKPKKANLPPLPRVNAGILI